MAITTYLHGPFKTEVDQLEGTATLDIRMEDVEGRTTLFFDDWEDLLRFTDTIEGQVRVAMNKEAEHGRTE